MSIIVYMDFVNIPEYQAGRIDSIAFEYDDTLTSAINGNSVIIPTNINKGAVTLQITGGGSGKIQTTTNLLQDVIDDNGVVWVDWDSGTVAATTQDILEVAVTAIRQVNVSGNSRMMLRFQ